MGNNSKNFQQPIRVGNAIKTPQSIFDYESNWDLFTRHVLTTLLGFGENMPFVCLSPVTIALSLSWKFDIVQGLLETKKYYFDK